jgi:hypothetical protein
VVMKAVVMRDMVMKGMAGDMVMGAAGRGRK